MSGLVAKRRVALFTGRLAGGGAQRVLVNLARGFAVDGFDVDLVVSRAEGPLGRDLPEGIRLVDLCASRALFAIPALSRYFRTCRPAAALATINYANVVALVALWLSGVRLPLTVREANVVSRDTYNPRSIKTRLLRVLMRLTYRHAHAVVVNSDDTRTGLIEWNIVAADRIHHIPNPIDSQLIAVQSAESPGHPWLPDEPVRPRLPVVVAAGRLVPQKDFRTLIDGFAIVCRRNSDPRLVILGEGPLRAELEDRIVELGIKDRVSMPGFVPNPYAFMRRASLFVLSSRWEGSPNVIVEALACGASVLSTDCPGGSRELIGDGNSAAPGRLVEVGSADAMAAAIVDMLNQSQDPHRSIAVASRHSLQTILPRYAQVMGLTPEQ